MIHYILQTIAFQLFFLLVYDLFLKKETFFNWNRGYLLATAALSLVLPFIKIDRFKDVVPQDYIVSLPEIILGQTGVSSNSTIVLDPVIIESHSLSILEMVFYSGLVIALFLFLLKVTKILILIIKNPKQSLGNVVLVELLNSSAAFSFFHYIFLGEHINKEDKDTILKHELIHTEQKHTIDLLFLEVLRVLFWFNPLVYMYQRRLATLHEFIADANALKHQDKDSYYQNLLAQVFETKNISFINTFFNQSLIKKRIVMLSRTKSKQIHLFKYALLIPLVFGMLVYTSCIQKGTAQNQDANITTNLDGESPLIEKIKAVKTQIEIQGNVSEDEAKGLDLLLKMIKHNELNQGVISEVQRFISSEYQSKLHEHISAVFEQIQIQGQLSNDEEKALKGLLILTSDDGFNDPFFADMLQQVSIPFGVIDQAPIFPGCESLSKDEQKQCTTEKITQHIVKNFNTKIGVDLGITGRERINVIFKIDREGGVIGVRSRASHPDLEAEAIRVVNTLPRMIPGTHKGKRVTVPYTLPIIFKIQGDTPTYENASDVPFSVVDQAPVFPGCEDLTGKAQKDCLRTGVSKHVNSNFNTKLASELGLTGRQRINVIFKINKEGDVIGIKSKAPHPGLEAEAVRVISTLPKMIPGKHKGKAVSVPYALPIIFQVADASDDKDWSGEEVVPFSVIDDVPVYPGCEDLKTQVEKKDCMSENITNFVSKNFNAKIANQHGLGGRQRVNVIFKINKEGVITGIRARAPHPALEKEAIRMISLLPKMKPGMHGDKVVTVPYSLPIIFEVEDNTQLLNEVAVVGYQPQTVDVPFSVVEDIPVFPGCEDSQHREALMKCTSDGIKKHVNKNFNAKLAKTLGLKGRQQISTIFKINTEGDITGIKSRAPHPDLQAEALRVLNSLPKMTPGKQKGKAVNVLFSLPIIFQVSD